jgi:hypothetical protein
MAGVDGPEPRPPRGGLGWAGVGWGWLVSVQVFIARIAGWGGVGWGGGIPGGAGMLGRWTESWVVQGGDGAGVHGGPRGKAARGKVLLSGNAF